jgi:phosphatidylglycerol:prolipoprotein diacylglycerol transferase
MDAVALLAALFLAQQTARRLALPPNEIWDMGMLAVFSGILGTKLLPIVQDWRDFLHYPLLVLGLSTAQDGRALLLGLLLASLAGWAYARARALPLLRALDAFAPAIALGIAIVQLGAFLAGSGPGRPTALPWGIVYTDRWAALWYGTPLGVRLHPTQLYACAVSGLLCAGLFWLLPRRRQDGEAFGAWLFLYGMALYWLGFLRYASGAGAFFHGAISLEQGIAFVMVIVGALLWMDHGGIRREAVPHAH